MGVGLRLLAKWVGSRFDPEAIRLREIARIRRAKERDLEFIDEALSVGDTATLAFVLRSL